MFLAHIDGTREQSIKSHAEGTAKRAQEFADAFSCGDWGYGCGLMHDIGKYSEKFQQRLHGGSITDHATAGAQELYKRKYWFAAYCVAGHHSGLLDGGNAADSGGEATLMGRMKKTVEEYQSFGGEITVPTFSNPPLKALGKGGFSMSFFIRMLFSCLVDADYLDTEYFMRNGHTGRAQADGIEVLQDRLNAYVKPWLVSAGTAVNERRTAILRTCLDRGEEAQGVFSLTVPTGGGKTVSSLAFALNHAKKHGLSRIIYVIPYTSIIEQNARVFKGILGDKNVLEDHCNVSYENKEELNPAQLASENWDRPVVVTTNVQFFESLFSNKTSKCRKIHNISNSVIIFDEAQMLPVPYLKPCIQAISELVHNYHSTAVLCTATQPSLQQFFPKQIQVKEICSDVKEQYHFFRRTTIQNLGMLTEDLLIKRLQKERQVLCILNSRKRVQRLYGAMKGEGTCHLSTLMYPNHRARLLKEIRERLKSGRTCRLIATSLVEAGVDFDFETVFRELAGIDSVIQAAGRCNREGNRDKESSRTVVFSLEKTEDIHIPPALKLPISVAEQIARQYEDIASLEAIEAYFHQLYYYKGEGLDSKNLIGQMEDGARSLLFPFASVAKQFKLIENETKTILIAKEPQAIAIADEIRQGRHSRQLVREAGHFCINLYDKDFDSLNGAGLLEPLPLDFYVLRNGEMYTEESGLTVDVERGEAVFA